jgi:hypothetical protein
LNTEDGVAAQSYADDILLFSNLYENMQTLVEVVNDLHFHSNILLKPKKCEMLKIGKHRNAKFAIKDPIP